MMEWTSDKPTKEGWYWLRMSGGASVIVRVIHVEDVSVYRDGWYAVTDGEMDELSSFSGEYEWSSEPIAEPISVKG